MTGNRFLMEKSKLQKNCHKKPCNSLATFLPRIVLVFNVTHTCVKAWFRWAAKPKLLTMLCSLFNSVTFSSDYCVLLWLLWQQCVFYCSYCDGLSSKTHCQCLQHYWLVPSSYSLKVIYIKHVFLVWCVPDYTAWYWMAKRGWQFTKGIHSSSAQYCA